METATMELSELAQKQLRFRSRMCCFNVYDSDGSILKPNVFNAALDELAKAGFIMWSYQYHMHVITNAGWSYLREHDLL